MPLPQPMLSFTQVIGSTLDVAGVGLNRTGTLEPILLGRREPVIANTVEFEGDGFVFRGDFGQIFANEAAVFRISLPQFRRRVGICQFALSDCLGIGFFAYLSAEAIFALKIGHLAVRYSCPDRIVGIADVTIAFRLAG